MDFEICSRLLIKVALTELDDSIGNLNVKLGEMSLYS